MNKKVFILSEHMDDEANLNFKMDGYTHIRAFHACRPLDVETYLTTGINPIDYESALKDVKERIVCDDVPESQAVGSLKAEWAELDNMHKRVWLGMNRELILSEASHYLIYGSEFICTLAMKLECRDRLREIGVPTIFSCDVPIEDISSTMLLSIQSGFNQNDRYNIAFSVNKVLPENIVSYEHPTKRLIDFLEGGTYKPDYEKLKADGFYD